MEQIDNMADWDLMCPILLDWLEDPIILPCCGKAISKIPLHECLKDQIEGERKCPNCNRALGHFNILGAPVSLNILNIVKRFKESNPLYLTNKKPSNQISPEWEGRVDWLEPEGSAYQTILGKLKLKCLDNKFQFKTLLIPVIDRSGSMNGSPITQCRYSLNRIIDLAYSNPNILTNIITYDDHAESILINTAQTIESYRLIVDGINSRGGTSFNVAFNEIVRVCGELIDPTITNISIIFLTDGQDSSTYGKSRSSLVTTLKDKLNSTINTDNINLQIHTIGFGASHDYDFLNSLRQITKVEGAYRYANPTEDADSLSNKINSLLDVIAQTVSIPIKIVNCPYPIIHSESPVFWLNLTDCVSKSLDYFDLEAQIGSDDTNKFNIRCKFNPDENNNNVWLEWYTHLVDELMGEVIGLVNSNNANIPNSLSTQIHLELIEQRTRAVSSRIKSSIDELDYETNIDLIRCDKIFNTINSIKAGNSFDANTSRVLNDLKFEGKFKTPIKSVSNQNNLGLKAGGVNLLVHRMDLGKKSQSEWKTILRQKLLRCENKIIKGLMLKTPDCIQWYDTNKTELLEYKDLDNMSFFEIICSIGKFGLVSHMIKLIELASTKEDLIKFVNTYTNKYNKTPLDLAIQNGYWKTCKILFDCGAKPNSNYDEIENLLRTCVSKNFWRTGEFMIFNGLVIVEEKMEDSVPTQEGLVWLSKMKGTESIDVFKAIRKSMYDVVSNSLDQIKSPITWSDYMDMFVKPSSDQIKVIDILMSAGKASSIEILDVMEAGEPEKTTPLYISCEQGNIELFYTILKYIPPEQLKSQVDWQNLKGTSCLWIASCNKHTDIVTELLGMGADPNIVNLKGDSPLIPTCQKGSESIVQLLLAYGCDLEKFNPERENALMVCCRNGQAKLLDLILSHIQTNMDSNKLRYYLNWCAKIDGFNPIMSAVELGNIECLKVIYKYDSNLEYRTGNDNAIIAGATPLHLASFYGRTSTVKTLIDLGADIYSQTISTKSNCLHLAIQHGHKDLVRFLMDKCEKTIKLLKMEDLSGRIPEYYAHLAGNEDLKEEFFTSKLSLMFSNLFVKTEVDEIECGNILTKYSESFGVYSNSNITNLNLTQGTTPLVWALLTGKNILACELIKMGANIFKPDDRGVSPYYWIKMLGLDMESLGINKTQLKLSTWYEIEDLKTSLQLNKLDVISKSNPQYKMLLQFKTDMIAPLTIVQPNSLPDLLLKMLDGFNLGDINKSIQMITNPSPNMNLISFIDKLKSNKIIQLDENKTPQLGPVNSTEYWRMILLDAKINLIKIISTADTTNILLNPNQILAIYLYTSNLELFRGVNQNLSSITLSSPWFGFIGCLYQGIKSLPNFVGDCFRAVDTLFDSQTYALGNKVEWGGFSVSNIDWKNSSELIRQKKGIVFIIKSKTGKNISSYSKFPQEKEIVFLPGTKFEVSNYYVPDIICLAQENIRNTTFKYNSVDKVRGFYDKAIEGKSSIIIELREI
jgi:ankyrin repeat protein